MSHAEQRVRGLHGKVSAAMVASATGGVERAMVHEGSWRFS
ncbi:MAG: hypothetical protein R3E42_15590 [Burkholderiaceae bacterium]